MMSVGSIDVLLALALPAVAYAVLGASRLATAVVLFIAFGLLSALIWARLDAPDVALVEAAVGAGLTGALLMSALRFVVEPPAVSPWRARSIPLIAAPIAAALVALVAQLPHQAQGLGPLVATHVRESGVTQPVTAVLMNFRGHDTHLEIVVLLTAAIGVRALRPDRVSSDPISPSPPLVLALVRLALPAIVVVGGYLVWRGSTGPGGAFQGGAILAGGIVLLLLAGRLQPLRLSSRAVRVALISGPVLFFVAAAAPLFFGGKLLEYPRAHAGAVILGLESALTVAIATILAMFVPEGSRPGSPR